MMGSEWAALPLVATAMCFTPGPDTTLASLRHRLSQGRRLLAFNPVLGALLAATSLWVLRS